MWFWWFMFCCGLIIPVLAIIAGRMMWKHCPSEINEFIGYRINRSMKNDDTWKFAHSFCGKLWWIIDWIMLFPSGLIQIPFFNSTYNVIGIVGAIIVGIQLFVLILTIIPTEIALKKTFTDDGTRR